MMNINILLHKYCLDETREHLELIREACVSSKFGSYYRSINVYLLLTGIIELTVVLLIALPIIYASRIKAFNLYHMYS